MFRTKVPVSRIMEWQRQSTAAPLLVLSKRLSKDAVTCFKVIQHVMGERIALWKVPNPHILDHQLCPNCLSREKEGRMMRPRTLPLLVMDLRIGVDLEARTW